MNIGFFGGSFNPPTFAHINLAKKAIKQCNLDKVIFVPLGDFHEKKELVKAIDRFNMLKIACDGCNNLEVSDMELDVKEKMYAIDAFKLIEKNFPDDNIYFILGADNFINMSKWKDYDELIKKYKYIVLNREDINVEEYISLNNINAEKIHIVENESYRGYSSTNFREALKEKKEIYQDMIPDVVLDYIIEHGLYNKF